MALSFSGTVLSGVSSSSFFNGRSCGGAAPKVAVVAVVPPAIRSKKMTWISAAAKGESNPIGDASKKASDFVEEKGGEAGEKGEEAKEIITEKSAEAVDALNDAGEKMADFARDKTAEVKEAIKPKST